MTALLVMASVARLLKKFRRPILMRYTAEMININLGSLTLSNQEKKDDSSSSCDGRWEGSAIALPHQSNSCLELSSASFLGHHQNWGSEVSILRR
jgi:hypothetical protein